jgi:hypothetical protein
MKRMKTWQWVPAALLLALGELSWMGRAETVETQTGPVACWTARPDAAGVVCVTSNGIITIPWTEVTDERFPAPDPDPPASAAWFTRIGMHYAEISGKLVARELLVGKVISVIPERKLVLVSIEGQVVAVAGIMTDGLVDGAIVAEWCARAGEYQYQSAGGALSTVARYLVVPAISSEAFGRNRESSYPKIAEARAASRQANMDAMHAVEQAQQLELQKKDEVSRANAKRMAEADRARAARLHEKFRMK